MPVLGVWENFDGGHWGNHGAELAANNQYGGINMIRTETGGIMPMSASRPLQISNIASGVVYGMFWGWGADGRVYYMQTGASTLTTTTNVATVFRFDPDPTQTISQTEVGGIRGPITYQPDWVGVGTNIYVTVWGDRTYKINTATPSISALTGSYGAAPAGRCIALYGERLVVGGVSDTRFGTVPNRIVFSGDDTNNVPTDTTAWETLNYFDLGADGTPITALYPARDHLIAVLEDQQVYLITGVLGTSTVARRIRGFDKGSGAISAFTASNGAVDPDQTTLWLFDHSQRCPASLNGTQYSRSTSWGSPHASRTATDITEGTMAMVGGPGEFVMYGVAASEAAADGVTSTRLFVSRINGGIGLGQRDVIGLRST